MRGYELVTNPEHERLGELITETYTQLGGMYVDEVVTPEHLAVLTLCGVASRLLVKLALEEHIYAAVEDHQSHVVASLTHPDHPPKDNDLIACLMWGQFSDKYEEVILAWNTPGRPAYIGPRSGIKSFVRPSAYAPHYDIESIMFKQHTYTVDPEGRTAWLRTRFDALQQRRFPIGKIDYAEFIARPEGAYARVR